MRSLVCGVHLSPQDEFKAGTGYISISPKKVGGDRGVAGAEVDRDSKLACRRDSLLVIELDLNLT